MNNYDDMNQKSNMIIYTTEDGLTKIETTFDEDTVWLSIDQMAELFQRDKSTISRHIKNVFSEGELQRESVVANFATTAADGKTYQVDYYNLDVIISVGYRVKSKRGTQFRIWATNILKEYMKKGFALDDERLKNLGGGGYFKELLERIRDIRASEKVFYRQVLEIYATSIDYDPKAEISIRFFKKVQNKIHYAIHGQTAAEVIYTRADAEKEFMGLTTFAGNQPPLKEAIVAKNYLNEKELRAMGQLVSGYLDFAERQAEREQAMTRRLNDLYDQIYKAEDLLQEGLMKKATLESEQMSVQSMIGILSSFDAISDRMNAAERRDLVKYLISEVELFPREEQKTQKRFVKAIAYKFPIEQKVLTQFDECGASIETVVLLSKDML